MVSNGAILAGMGVGLEAVAAEVFRVKPATALPQAAKHDGDLAAQSDQLKKAIADVAVEMN